MKEMINEIISKYRLKTIEDVLNVIPLSMCHITQESDVFNTYNPMTVRMAYPESDWERYESVYKQYSEVIIPSLALEDYLKRFLDDGDRLPCFCSEVAEVVGALLSQILGQTVYVIRRTFVNYLTQPTRRHCLNAIVENGRIRYIDGAVYNQVLNKKNKKLIHPSKLESFNAADIDESFLGDDFLHSTPFQREIYLEGGVIKDTFYPNPGESGLRDEYFRQYDV
ncbi:MAG: hypothetical protein WAW86_04400 [Gammaproteobacteria bacterium]